MSAQYCLTLDAGILSQFGHLPEITSLNDLSREGRIRLVEADHAATAVRSTNTGWPGGPPPTVERKTRNSWRPVKKMEAGAANFKSIAGILFAGRTEKLSMTEVNNVTHVIMHLKDERDIFVTLNDSVYIAGGRRERLHAAFGLVVMTPTEALEFLKEHPTPQS